MGMKYWFRKRGWIYMPISIMGWLLTLVLALLITWMVKVADRHSHSGSDTLMNTFPWAWIGTVTLGWIASKTSGGKAR